MCHMVLAAMLMVVELASGGGADGVGLVGLGPGCPHLLCQRVPTSQCEAPEAKNLKPQPLDP